VRRIIIGAKRPGNPTAARRPTLACDGGDVERVVTVEGPFDRLLEHRPLVVGRVVASTNSATAA